MFNPTTLLASVIVLTCFACKSKLASATEEVVNEYTVSTYRRLIYLETGRGGGEQRKVSIVASNDSAAYMQGIKAVVAHMWTDTLSKDKIQYLELDPKRIFVYDAHGNNIIDRLPKSTIEYGLAYFKRHKPRSR